MTTIGIDLRLPCSSTAGTLFHELLHANGRYFDHDDITDQIRSCEAFCFPDKAPATARQKACCFAPASAECRLNDGVVATAHWVRQWTAHSSTKSVKPECAPSEKSGMSSQIMAQECLWKVQKEGDQYVVASSCSEGSGSYARWTSHTQDSCVGRGCLESRTVTELTDVKECTGVSRDNHPPSDSFDPHPCLPVVQENHRKLTIDSAQCDGTITHYNDEGRADSVSSLVFLQQRIRPSVDGYAGSRSGSVIAACPVGWKCLETYTWNISPPH